ncbi:protein NUCLEOLAR COMPLEX ASSOCIATED [Trifolium repens]|nr:protein NUCLEOLAR COMPLEX ASSOCIATED [Trifolium repens]
MATPSKRNKKNKTAKQHSVAELKTLGKELLSSASHINNLPILLTYVSPSSPPQLVLESLLSIHSYFLPLLPQLPPSTATASDEGDKSEFIHLTWLRSKFDEFLKSLIDVLVSDKSDEILKEAVLDTLMEFVTVANGGAFHSSLYNRILRSIIHSTGPAEFLIDLLTSNYFKYIDVRYFTFISLEKITRNLEGKDVSDDKTASADLTDESQSCSNIESVIHNMYYTISHVPPPEKSDDTSNFQLWSVSARVAKKMKLKFTKAWIAYLRLPLPLDVYKEVLVNLHQAVMPHLSNPVILSDFLTRSYDVGGVVSVMALNSLFDLMIHHGLEYPNFYEKLYALLVPSIFMAKHRARFFQLLDSCLKSNLLPAYLAASFAKKLSRLLLSVPPSGALVIIALVHNILRRHPSVNCLVHREDFDEDSDHKTDEVNASKLDDAQTGATACQKSGIDHFNIEESDPMKSGAMRSSLWEIDTALHHYCPPVSRNALSLGTDLTNRAKTTDANVGDFSAGSYATILGAEITRRVKQVPLAFYKTTPTSLFSENDFAGWTFKCEETSEINDSNENAAKDLLEPEHSAKRQRIECQ